jgi:hypothetical protein
MTHADLRRGAAPIFRGELVRGERRWPVLATILVVLAILLLMPNRVRLLPPWGLYLAAALVLAPMFMVSMRPRSSAWLRIERFVTFAFVAGAAGANLTTLEVLVAASIGHPHEVGGLELLASSIAVWAGNVLMFSLLYWQLDRGGPAGRCDAGFHRPDWIFAQDGASEDQVGPDWRPQFVDYLFLGYSTATAFSTTDAVPLTARAKLAMMAESSISLLTLVVVAARAINVLGS